MKGCVCIFSNTFGKGIAKSWKKGFCQNTFGKGIAKSWKKGFCQNTFGKGIAKPGKKGLCYKFTTKVFKFTTKGL
jgi:hypothetical protein